MEQKRCISSLTLAELSAELKALFLQRIKEEG